MGRSWRRSIEGALLAGFFAVRGLACAELENPARLDAGSAVDASADALDAVDALDATTSGTCDLARPSSCGAGFFCWTFAPACTGVGECLPLQRCDGQRIGPVCGCDGKVYANPCDAYVARTTLAPAESCPAVEKRFPCGPEFCDPLLQYCFRATNSPYRGCKQSPPECFAKTTDSEPDCACWPEAGVPSCSVCRVIGGATRGLEFDCRAPVGP